MLNLVRQFSKLYITGADAIPHVLVPYLGAQEIVLGGDPVLFPASRLTNGSVSPSVAVVGSVLTFTLPTYTGSGPIEIERYVAVGGVSVTPITSGGGSAVYQTSAVGQTQLFVRARGASGVWTDWYAISIQVASLAPPAFSQVPSMLPAVVVGGNELTVNPGTGPSLTWTLTLNGADVKAQVVGGKYTTPVSGGLMVLTSTITNAGGSVTQSVNSSITAFVPDPGTIANLIITTNSGGFVVENAGPSGSGSVESTTDGFTVKSN